jgi:hypothetical protein
MRALSLRLPFAFGPRTGAAENRARQKRVPIVLVVVLLVGLAAGLVLALRTPGGPPPGGPLTGKAVTARFRLYRFSLRYPGPWTLANWSCQPSNPEITPIAVLTNAQPAPKCPGPTEYGGYSFPPRQQLGANTVSISLANGDLAPFAKLRWNARVDGRPARIERPASGRDPLVGCAGGNRHESRQVFIKAPHVLLNLGATICGPDLATGNAALNRILASIRFRR